MKQYASTVILTPEERAELEARARSMKLRSDAVGRAKLILMLADGATYRQIRSELGFTTATTSKWKKRFLENRVGGLKSPPAGITQWSTRTLAKVLGVHYLSVARLDGRLQNLPAVARPGAFRDHV
jgi:hypothetical protein